MIVAIEKLKPFFSTCHRSDCFEPVLPCNQKYSIKGAALKVEMTCNDGHTEFWASSSDVGQGRECIPYINLKLIYFLFVTGLHYEKIKTIFSRCKILFFSATTYYKIKKKFLYNVIWSYWLAHQAENLEKLREARTGLVLCGDARFDSVGHSAKYMTYFIQETGSRVIIALEVGMKAQVKNSGEMEVKGCERLLKFLESVGLNIRVFSSDWSTTIRKLLETKFPHILHQNDPWHYNKNIKKRLYKSFHLKSCQNLPLWQRSITNMIWWALETSVGNPSLAKQKILSIFHHVTNRHEFEALVEFPKCAHEELTEERPWIDENSLEFKKLVEAIMGKDGRNLDNLDKMSEFVHTSDIESLNSLILKYCNKTYVYGWKGMLVRSALAAMDFNFNVNRSEKSTTAGDRLYKTKINRSASHASVVAQKVDKSYDYLFNIFDILLVCLEKGTIPIPKFPIDEALEKRKRHSFDKASLVDHFESKRKKAKYK